MENYLKMLQDKQQDLNNRVLDKFKRDGSQLTDEEIFGYSLNDSDKELFEMFQSVANGEVVPGFHITNFLSTPQAKVLIPRVIIGTARKAADPIYLASKYFKKVRLKSGNSIEFPTFGVMRAYDVVEGAEIPEQSIDWNTYTNSTINVGKVGVRVQYTDEIIKDTEFDIVGMLTAEAGRAMARHKEQKAFTEFIKHGHIVFDNEYARVNANNPDPALAKMAKDAGTTGVDYDNNLNGTMSLEDYLDLCIALHNNGYTPSETVMHSLAFPAFVKNGLTGALTAASDQHAKVKNPNGSWTIGPGAMMGKLPFAMTVSLSPFAPFNKTTKTFDMIVVDKDNVGYQVVKEEIKTDNFRDPARDLNNVKLIERYGFGVKDQGFAVCVARNISMAKSYPLPQRVSVMNK